MADVLLFQTVDGGEVAFENGQPLMSDGPESAVFLSLFGGNEYDTGSDGDASKQWWGNVSETEPAKLYRSETQALLRGLSAVSSNLLRLEEAGARDLAWMTESGFATFVSVAARMVILTSGDGTQRVGAELNVLIEIDGRKVPLKFVAPWQKA